MAEKIQKNDFIEFSYVGSIEEDDFVFDTNIESEAKAHDIYNAKASYEPIIICVGQGQVMEGIDEFLVGQDTENTYDEVFVEAEKAFGKKDMKNIQMISMGHFKKQGLRPFKGMEVNIDNAYGVVKSINGGRVIVDFNHPLASKDLLYKVVVGKKVTDKNIQIQTIIEQFFRIPKQIFSLKDNNVAFTMEVPEQVQTSLKEKIKELTGSDVTISVEKKEPGVKKE